MPFREDIKSPFNLLMLALAIVGVSAAFYFYFFPHNERGIAYTAEVPSLIYDSRISTPAIHLVDSQNAPITSDTYLQTFTVWNSGSAPIEPNEVRRPLAFMFQGAKRILDCRIVNATDQDVCGFQLSKTSPSGAPISNAVVLDWKHFDPRKGVKFQVIYEQEGKPSTLIIGDIVGISKFQAGAKERSRWLPLGLLGLMFAGGYWCFYMVRDGIRSKGFLRWSAFALGGSVACFILLMAWNGLFLSILPTPPI